MAYGTNNRVASCFVAVSKVDESQTRDGGNGQGADDNMMKGLLFDGTQDPQPKDVRSDGISDFRITRGMKSP